MDIQKCGVCEREFDFDRAGFQGPDGDFVCSEDCANTFAAQRGTPVVIQDEHEVVIARNHEPGGTLKRPGH